MKIKPKQLALRDIRVEKNLTQIELAELVDQPQQVISKIERGHRRLYATQLFEYVQNGFGMSPTDFVKRYTEES